MMAWVLVGGCGTEGSLCPEAMSVCLTHATVVDAAWVQARLDEEVVQVVDARSAEAYADAHVRGALSLPSASLRTTRDGVSGQVVDEDAFLERVRSAGLRQGSAVVVYGDGNWLDAARLMWTLQLYGHPDVRLLDGGWPHWTDRDGATETGEASADATDYRAELRSHLRVDADWVLAHLDDTSVALVDARSREEYGEGHIPGAVNVEWSRAVDDDGSLKPVAELERLYADVPFDGTVVTYCTTGVRGSMAYATLRALGHPDVRVYDGSWAEWSRSGDRPVERP